MKKRVAIIGSGFAAWGALLAIRDRKDIDITVYDIGLEEPRQGPHSNVPNGKKYRGSFFGYGINDKASPVLLKSKRMCSSHTYGGHSTVYSGAVLYPKSCDLAGWPKQSLPTAEDYSAVLSSLPLVSEQDELSAYFPVIPKQSSLNEHPENDAIAVLGASRISTTSDTKGNLGEVFNLQSEFKSLELGGRIEYRGRHYVEQIERNSGELYVNFSADGKVGRERHDAVFLGAGCINSTAIVDRSLHGSGERQYAVFSPRLSIAAFVCARRKFTTAIKARQSAEHPQFFLEIRSPKTRNAWSHSQITRVNRQIIDAIKARLPKLLHFTLSPLQNCLYFVLSSSKSTECEPAAIITSKLERQSDGRLTQTLVIDEKVAKADRDLAIAVKKGIAEHWNQLRMLPFPFGSWFADFFRGNRLGGWHFGGTLPMGDGENPEAKCNHKAELLGLPNTFIIDAAAFPTVPASTVALLTATHAYRVAKRWSTESKASIENAD